MRAAAEIEQHVMDVEKDAEIDLEDMAWKRVLVLGEPLTGSG